MNRLRSFWRLNWTIFFLPLPALSGCLHSLAHSLLPIGNYITLTFPSSITFFLLLSCYLLSFRRTLVIILTPPGQSRIISPSQDTYVNHICKVPLPCEVAYSLVPRIRTEIPLGGHSLPIIFCSLQLKTQVYRTKCIHPIPTFQKVLNCYTANPQFKISSKYHQLKCPKLQHPNNLIIMGENQGMIHLEVKFLSVDL